MCGATLSAEQLQEQSAEPTVEAVEESEKRGTRIRQKTMTVPESAVQSIKASVAAAAPLEEQPAPAATGFRFGERRADQVFASAAAVPPAPVEREEPDPAYSERLSMTARALRDLEEDVEASSDLAVEAQEENWVELDENELEPETSSNPPGKVNPLEPNSVEADAPRAKRKRKRKRKKGGAQSGILTPAVNPGVGPVVVPSVALSAVSSAEDFTMRVPPPAAVAAPNATPLVAVQNSPRPQPQNQSRRRVREVPEGGLVGWFVSYAGDEGGKATEIRAGRFFICGEKLKETDLVLADTSLSTPHCLVKATANEGLRIQDLMSEQGTYLRRRDEKEYRRQNETVNIVHGDWLKFGEYEVMVCLIAFPYEAES